MIRTSEGRINSWNRRAEELYGWSKEEAVGRISHDLLRTQFPKPLQEIESELVRNRQWRGKLLHSTRGGGRIVVESRWTLDLERDSGTVVEINRPCADDEIGSEAGTDTDSVEIGRQDPVSTSNLDVDDLLPRIASIVLAGGAFLCILVSFYVLYHYAWMAERQFSNSISKALYYFVPVSLASFLSVSLRFRPPYKINLALLCVSLAASLYGIELFLQSSNSILGPSRALRELHEPDLREQKAKQIAKNFGVDVDVRTPVEFIADLRKDGVDAVPIISPSNSLFIEQPDGSVKSAVAIHGTEVIPFGALSNKVTVLCNENGYYVTYPSDQHGFHNPRGIWKSHRMDIVALGDSFAHGYCVPSGKNFIDPIRRRYPATLNLGMAGHGPLLTVATIEEYVAPFKPKTVLWFYYENNDLTDLQTEKRSSLLMRYMKDGFSQNLLARQVEIDKAITDDIPRQTTLENTRRAVRIKNRQNINRKLLKVARLASLRDRLGVDRTTREDAERLADLENANMELFRDILSKAKTRVGGWNGTLYFVYLPNWGRYAGDLSIGAEQRSKVLKLVRHLGSPVIDLDPAFQAQSDPLSLFPFREYGHYNEKGHQLVAEEVIKILERKAPST